MKQYISNFTMIVVFMVALFGCNSDIQSQDNGKAAVININAADVQKIVTEEDAVIIDVRTAQETASGYIAGTTVFADIYADDFEQKINALDKSKTYIVYCRSGARSRNASAVMMENGFTKVYNLSGGIQGWNGKIETP